MLSSVWNWLTDLGAAVASAIIALGALLLIILIAWFVVWYLFLRHIPACRELAAMLLPQAIAPSTNNANTMVVSRKSTMQTRRASMANTATATASGATTTAIQTTNTASPLAMASRASTNTNAGNIAATHRTERSVSDTRHSPVLDEESKKHPEHLTDNRHSNNH
ncbi:hypothetical protein BDF22DRAFT_739142 [Syncephalis plumigaleata]|nr:hypothetical protein BDF22DRAFT_739142 [Syncephalis plumigaleata]